MSTYFAIKLDDTQEEIVKTNQVNFERVKEFVELLKESHNNWISSKATDNIILFFELLSKSSSFAHKAHKELNKLLNQ